MQVQKFFFKARIVHHFDDVIKGGLKALDKMSDFAEFFFKAKKNIFNARFGCWATVGICKLSKNEFKTFFVFFKLQCFGFNAFYKR